MSEITRLRPSPIAGLGWYEGDPDLLRQQVDLWLRHKAVTPAGQIIGVIAPHAGHVYSGAVAGAAFGCLVGQTYDLVVILSPYHDFTTSPMLTTAHAAYWTPLGEVPVDASAMEAVNRSLADQNIDPIKTIANDHEHSLEIELPFLQVALAQPFQLLPIMVQSRRPHLLKALAKAVVAACAGRKCLLVASSDLSHFYTDRVANQLDAEMLRRIQTFSPESVLEAEAQEIAFACGVGPIASILWAARDLGADTVTIVDYATSAAATGDTQRVVGYGAALITASSGQGLLHA